MVNFPLREAREILNANIWPSTWPALVGIFHERRRLLAGTGPRCIENENHWHTSHLKKDGQSS